MAKKTGTVKKKVVKVGAQGMAFVHSTFNNVIITLTNEVGEVISWSSAGKMGFRGSKKNTPYAAQTAASDCAIPAEPDLRAASHVHLVLLSLGGGVFAHCCEPFKRQKIAYS